MSDPIAQLGSVLQQEMTAVAAIAQNTANLQTSGYKAQSVFIQALQPTHINQPIEQQRQLASGIHMKNGALQPSPRPLDLAIAGLGWFWVQDSDGLYATRSGRFSLNTNQQLITSTGGRVLNRQGQPIHLPNDQVKISADGTIWDQTLQQRLDQLAVIAHHPLMRADGQGRYFVGTAHPTLTTEALVHQHTLEVSNVDMAHEMVKLMEFSRHIETVQKALATYNGILESGINQLGK